MSYDELELDRIGDRKTAVFFTISDTTPTYNFIVALAFSQMFNLLCERADNVHGGRLPHHVRVLWDEAANTGQVPQLEKLVAVIRSREVSLTLFYQQMAQCKAIYKDNAETIFGNMDTMIFQQTFTITNDGVQDDNVTNIIPCSISSASDYNNYQPTPAEGDEKTRIMEKIQERSSWINTENTY